MQNFPATIISEYANSPVIDDILGSFNAAMDPAGDIDNWYNLVWNVATAQGYGLDVWGRIVGVTRVLQIASATYFGFTGTSGTSGDSFNVAPFYSGQVTTNNYALTDDAFRQLIYAKAYFNISNGSVPAINNILMSLFGQQIAVTAGISGTTMTVTSTAQAIPVGMALSGPGISGAPTVTAQTSGSPGSTGIYTISSAQTVAAGTNLTGICTAHVADNQNMTMTYVFSFVPSAVQLSIIQNSGVLPRPSGVSTAVSHP